MSTLELKRACDLVWLALVKGRPRPPHERGLLLMLDEFPSYGKLEVFEEALAYIAGYGIKAYLINQDMSQLWGAYGKDESVLTNAMCGSRLRRTGSRPRSGCRACAGPRPS